LEGDIADVQRLQCHLPNPRPIIAADCALVFADGIRALSGRHTGRPARTVVRVEPEQPTDAGALHAETPAFAHRMFELLQQRRPA
jgi:hypothetical protein